MPKINVSRRHFLETAAMTVAAGHFGRMASAKTRTGLTPLGRATAWLNSQPLTDTELHGKVVLIEFWTYTCINWRRQLPYVRAWANKYKDSLVVIGVHSPEFSFEQNIDNIRWAAKDMRVDYPIAVDNDHAIWRGFNNEYWPALYFVDGKGKIRHQQSGEGKYQQSEKEIQRLLAETGGSGNPNQLVSLNPSGAEAEADWKHLQSGENYVGYERTENFAWTIARDKRRIYSLPKQLGLKYWGLSGDWTMGREAILLNQPGGRIVYRFHARDLHLVMGPAAPNRLVRFQISIDGQPPHAAHGIDVDGEGKGTVIKSRMYQLIRQRAASVIDRQFEIEFLDSGLEAFSFTFG
jgi:thiol-disulfide isomerase/thioredoxin